MAAPGGRNTTSLRAILTQAKPELSCKKYPASENTIGRWPILKHHGIAEWSEFNLESLNESYGHILNREVPGGILAPDLPNNELKISGVPDIRRLIEWNRRVIDIAEKFTKESLGIDTGVSLLNDVTTPNKSVKARIRTIKARGTPDVDHVIALDDHPLTNLVVGLVKSHWKFPASVVVDDSQSTSVDQMWALGQLANLCKLAKTRYGYIMTDHALVACRYTIFEKDSEYHYGRFKVALMPVPWSKRGPEQLTTDLALWWLCMLAASAPHNRSTLEHEMVPINKWEVKYYDDGRGWVRRHKYSGYEEPTEAPSPPPYETPAPDDVAGNAALFMAGVGLNAQEDFDPNAPPIPGQPADLAQPYQHNPTDVVVAYDGQGLSFDVTSEGQDYDFNFDAANEGEDFDFNLDAANEGQDHMQVED
ncbi:hypothetical protein MGU_09756 [Metarhizium guizhouense ARSEF 977]|uniref:Uncharacterized protein n=1 Tax=Metarhizium guizhouense (strain ARSEF 977) TaxID=1276136 RepID=A0A0B4G865_METGA|nr:hypothetical protein MGU_09756 [Metarhizium guizhouense ARSEF 977]